MIEKEGLGDALTVAKDETLVCLQPVKATVPAGKCHLVPWASHSQTAYI